MMDGFPFRNSTIADVERDESLVFSGISLAQLGKIAESNEILLGLRDKYSAGQSPRLTIHLMILEGLIWYYECRRPESLDRVRRAHMLASAGSINDLKIESAVWLAHLAFNFEAYASLKSSLLTALAGADSLKDDLRARVCLVVADSCRFLGQISRGDSWYKLARIFARRCRDRGVVAAIEYNRIVMGLSRARLENFLSRTESLWVGNNWSAEFLSIKRLHEGMGVSSLSELLLLCESYGRQLDGDYCAAAESLISIRNAGAAESCGLSIQALDLEISWCQALCGPRSSVSEEKVPTLDEIEEWSLNEQFIGLMQLQDLVTRRGLQLDEERFEGMLSRSSSNCRVTLDDLGDAVADVDEFLPMIRVLGGVDV
jgi:hypothetical protein